MPSSPAPDAPASVVEELSPQQLQNFNIGKEKKEVADKAFKAGDPKAGKNTMSS